MQPPRPMDIGIIEDDAIMGRSLVQRFELEGHKVVWWTTGSDAVNATDFLEKDIIVCDIRLPDITGETVMRQAGRNGLAPPFLFITGYGDIDQAVRLMRLGACDYMTKPFEFEEFINRIIRSARGAQKTKNMTRRLGQSAEMQALEKSLIKFSQTDFPVLIIGESGVGKESAARFLHGQSSTSGHPFMAVNCAAIPADLLEKEIFGEELGSLNDHVSPHRGYAERVGCGTMYLSEVDRIPVPVQAKLMELVETNSFTRIGGSATIVFAGRIVVSNNSDLKSAVSKGQMRDDLSFRLSVLSVDISPLRNRPEDVEWLLPQMVATACSRQGQLPKTLSAQAEEFALAHDWTGNAFEMRNRVERAVGLSRDQELAVTDLFPEFHVEDKSHQEFPSLAQAREMAEKRQIIRALERSGGQIGIAAKLLGVSRTTLWDKMTRLDLGLKERS
ncbi:sigma-54-dependent transcriptional regulator [Hoeflea alexandrii]|uniref:sigma-54-dependent transcriptional regulator n=1 Tax=Hoeflea alexandrii TaxID=288436 RepID=UPI0022AFBE88|nr:sigma-54 dependent transcriptional regulator [Hoeflea alexandrii]